jgi:parallel beta-helix repeat protein
MKRKMVSAMILTLLLTSTLTFALNIQPVRAESNTICVDDDNIAGPWDGTPEHPYQNITSGLEHAVAGDTVFVYNGTYYENLVLDEGLNLVGESNMGTTIDAGGFATYAIDIVASYVNISRFNIINGAQGRCVRLLSVDVCNVSDNRFSSVYTAVEVYDSDDNTISRNYLEDISGAGIGVSTGHNNTISENFIVRAPLTFFKNAAIGLAYNCTGNTISLNNITQVSEGTAIELVGAGPRDNTISGNNITTCEVGIGLRGYVHANIIMDNTITDCHQMSEGEYYGYGMLLGTEYDPCNENLIIRNNITKCTRRGIVIWVGHGNTIYHNYLADNNVNAADSSGDNDWDDGYPSGGNYWSDYGGADLCRGPFQNETGGDGIGDTPYVIDQNNEDHYPLMTPWQPHDTAVLNVTTSKDGCLPMPIVCQNYTAKVNVTVTNRGASLRTFNVTAYANATVIGKAEVSLAAGNIQTIMLVWNTSTFAKGNYTISAVADTVAGDETPADNNFTDGVVQVVMIGDVCPTDGYVGIDDIFNIASHFGQERGQPGYNPNKDITDDDYIGIDDIFTAAQHFAEEDP